MISKRKQRNRIRAKARRRMQIDEDRQLGIHHNPRREDKQRGLDGTMRFRLRRWASEALERSRGRHE